MSSSPGQPVTSAYRKPWKVMVGSKKSVAAAEDEPVGRLGVAQRADAELAVLEHLGVPEPDLRAAPDPRTVNRSQPTRFCPKSTSVRPDGERQIRTGRQRLVTDHGRTDVRRQPRACRTPRVRTGSEPLRASLRA